jgi:hypothetical protein
MALPGDKSDGAGGRSRKDRGRHCYQQLKRKDGLFAFRE